MLFKITSNPKETQQNTMRLRSVKDYVTFPPTNLRNRHIFTGYSGTFLFYDKMKNKSVEPAGPHTKERNQKEGFAHSASSRRASLRLVGQLCD